MNRIKISIVAMLLGAMQLSAQMTNSDTQSIIIEYLLENPKTAQHITNQEELALRFLGRFLRTKGQRQHELNVASAQSPSITIGNTGATLSMDEQGNVYITQNGITRKISDAMVSRAREMPLAEKIEGATLPVYDIGQIAQAFRDNDNYQEETFLYQRQKGVKFGEMIKDKRYDGSAVVQTFKLRNDGRQELTNRFEYNHFDEIYSIVNPDQGVDPVWRGSVRSLKPISEWGIKKGQTFALTVLRWKNNIKTLFTCSWAQDFNGDGLDINDFNDPRRAFYEDEKITVGFTSSVVKNATLAFSVYDNKGQRVWLARAVPKRTVTQEGILTEAFIIDPPRPGIYTMVLTLSLGEEKSMARERLEILPKKDD